MADTVREKWHIDILSLADGEMEERKNLKFGTFLITGADASEAALTLYFQQYVCSIWEPSEILMSTSLISFVAR